MMVKLGSNSVNLFLIRHAESVDNVAGLYGGISDAELTNHGILQTTRLARHLQDAHGRFTHVFASDLQRARRTGEAIVDHQNSLLVDKEIVEPSDICSLQVLPVLREQDFGSLERQPFSAMATANLQARKKEKGWVAPETKANMDLRADAFLEEHIWPLLMAKNADGLGSCESNGEPVVAVVSHGMLLSRLWKRLLTRCPNWSQDVVMRVDVGPRGLEHLGSWTNTGYLHLLMIPRHSNHSTPEAVIASPKSESSEVIDEASEKSADTDSEKTQDRRSSEGEDSRKSSTVPSFLMIVNAVNATEHLKGLKRTRGGIGSAAHDGSQRSIDSFFKKRKLA